MRRSRRQIVEYIALLAGSLVFAVATSYLPLAGQIDKDAYDWFFRLYRPPDWTPQSIVLAIDEDTFHTSGGVSGTRRALAEGLDLIAPAGPKAVAIDVILAEEEEDPADSNLLERAIRLTPNVVLACDLTTHGDAWEDPLPRFLRGAAGKGNVHAEPDPVCRETLLHKADGLERRWALGFEAYRAGAGGEVIETQHGVEVGGLSIPAPGDNHPIWIRYRPPDRPVPKISLARLKADPTLARQFAGKTVFFGVTAQTAGDRQQTPYSSLPMPGVEIHANVFETIANRLFLVSARDVATLEFCVALVAAAGLVFYFLSGWAAYVSGFVVLMVATLA